MLAFSEKFEGSQDVCRGFDAGIPGSQGNSLRKEGRAMWFALLLLAGLLLWATGHMILR